MGDQAEPTWKRGGRTITSASMCLLQPDVGLDLKPTQCSVHTYVQLFKRTEELVEVLQTVSPENLQEMIGFGRKMAKSHSERFRGFEKLPPKQACLLFGGESLRAVDFGEAEQRYAQSHLRFVSGLYGLLRPFDDVKPVRDLPMGAKLKTKRGSSLLEFWGDSISKQLSKDAAALGGDKVLVVTCLTEEYRQVLREDNADLLFVHCIFSGASDDAARRGRGELARYVCQKRVRTVEDVRGFGNEDWILNTRKSVDARLVFSWQGAASQEEGETERKKKKKSKREKEKEGKGDKRERERTKRKKESRESRSSGSSGAKSPSLSRSRSTSSSQGRKAERRKRKRSVSSDDAKRRSRRRC